MKQQVAKSSWLFLFELNELECEVSQCLAVKCGPLCARLSFLWIPESSTCLHFLVPMTAVCSIHERLAGNILSLGGSRALWNSHHLHHFGNHGKDFLKNKNTENIVYKKSGEVRVSWPRSTTFCCPMWMKLWERTDVTLLITDFQPE